MAPPDTATPTLTLDARTDPRWIRDFAFDGVFFLGSTLLVFLVAQLFSAKGGGSNVLQVTGAAEALNGFQDLLGVGSVLNAEPR